MTFQGLGTGLSMADLCELTYALLSLAGRELS